MINFQNLADFFYLHPWVFNACTLVVGTCIGSFLNVVIYRLPLMLFLDADAGATVKGESSETENSSSMNLAFPRSFCPKCLRTLSWRENIPLLSYLVLKGRCKNCLFPISMRSVSYTHLTLPTKRIV